MLTSPDNSQQEINAELSRQMAEFYADPLGHVLFSYPWESENLRGFPGPRTWQAGFLIEVGQEVEARGFDGINAVAPIMFSTSSGHGIGKSANVCFISRWILDTRPFSKGVVTANTGEQLRTKTWSELAKWHSMAITKHWWTLTSGSGSLSYYNKTYRERWRMDAFTSREENSEAFAGLHAANSTPFYIFDEASAVPNKIFEVREGGLTDGEPMTFDFGNPTRNTGRFHENMVGRFRHNFNRRSIDSRDVEGTNKELFEQWARDYGEDSDFFKVRVRGVFPVSGSLQFIPTDLYESNVERTVIVTPTDPVVVGVDVARFGDDQSVIHARHGRDHAVIPTETYRELDTMSLAAKVSEFARAHKPDAIFIDGGGVGGGVVDRCRQLGLDVIEINFGGKATQRGYSNLRAQMWGNMRDALKDGVRLPQNDDLRADLTSLEYGYNIRNDIQLERKEDMKARGLASPDLGDAYALTYVLPVAPNRAGYSGAQYDSAQSEYDPI
jgi:hypothetical protein